MIGLIEQKSLYGQMDRRVWRYKRGNQNPHIEEEPTTQWPNEKVQKDKQRSSKHTYKTRDWVTRTPLNTRDELRCSGRVSSSCSTSETCHVNLVTIVSTDKQRWWQTHNRLWPYILSVVVSKHQNKTLWINFKTYKFIIYMIGD